MSAKKKAQGIKFLGLASGLLVAEAPYSFELNGKGDIPQVDAWNPKGKVNERSQSRQGSDKHEKPSPVATPSRH